mmetsp:Transcript_14115/g.46666  ORF Transcript_14115/g.46666 Transcript_14115/m.46666 type:complete len:217 (-) Transcript_14115:88-738(-)
MRTLPISLRGAGEPAADDQRGGGVAQHRLDLSLEPRAPPDDGAVRLAVVCDGGEVSAGSEDDVVARVVDQRRLGATPDGEAKWPRRLIARRGQRGLDGALLHRHRAPRRHPPERGATPAQQPPDRVDEPRMDARLHPRAKDAGRVLEELALIAEQHLHARVARHQRAGGSEARKASAKHCDSGLRHRTALPKPPPSGQRERERSRARASEGGQQQR